MTVDCSRLIARARTRPDTPNLSLACSTSRQRRSRAGPGLAGDRPSSRSSPRRARRRRLAAASPRGAPFDARVAAVRPVSYDPGVDARELTAELEDLALGRGNQGAAAGRWNPLRLGVVFHAGNSTRRKTRFCSRRRRQARRPLPSALRSQRLQGSPHWRNRVDGRRRRRRRFWTTSS